MGEKIQDYKDVSLFPVYQQEETFPNIHKLIISFRDFLKDHKKFESSNNKQKRNGEKNQEILKKGDKKFKKILSRELN